MRSDGLRPVTTTGPVSEPGQPHGAYIPLALPDADEPRTRGAFRAVATLRCGARAGATLRRDGEAVPLRRRDDRTGSRSDPGASGRPGPMGALHPGRAAIRKAGRGGERPDPSPRRRRVDLGDALRELHRIAP